MPPKKLITKPSFKPTDQQRKQVEAMAAYGVPIVDIARVMGIGSTTLKKYFQDELDLGHVRANAAVAETCFKMATSGKVPAATFFWMKTRAGWRETNHIEHSGAINFEDMTDEQRIARIRELSEQLAIGVSTATRVSSSPRTTNTGSSKLN